MLHSFEYDQIVSAYYGDNVIKFIDVLLQLMNYYIKIAIDPKILYDLFIVARALLLLVVPNNLV
jgi:hypothetical protein